MVEQGSEVKAIKVKEIRRQKIYVPKSMTTNQVMEKYGLKPGTAYTARKKGFFVKNFSRPQVCVDPSKFDPDIMNFSKISVTPSYREEEFITLCLDGFIVKFESSVKAPPPSHLQVSPETIRFIIVKILLYYL
jgi:hypothetical protein